MGAGINDAGLQIQILFSDKNQIQIFFLGGFAGNLDIKRVTDLEEWKKVYFLHMLGYSVAY